MRKMLLRIQQPDGSWDLPDGLIDRIECCGLMVTVGHWVLEESLSIACSLARARHYAALVGKPLCAATDAPKYGGGYAGTVNPLSHSAGNTDSGSDRKADVLTTLMLAVAILRPLRNAGVRVALDDFGMGYAGLRQLQHMKSLPIDVLKIDKMFVEGLPEDSSMIAAIIMLAQSLNLQMIAEGVETEAQRDWLAKAGVGIARSASFLLAHSPIEIFEESYPEEK